MSKNFEKIDESFLDVACQIIGETKEGLSTTELIKLCNKYATEYDVKISITSDNNYKLKQFSNKADLLRKNLSCFQLQEQFFILKTLLNDELFTENEEAKKILAKLYQKYGYLDDNLTNSEIIIKTKQKLEKYHRVSKTYLLALKKYEEHRDDRNLLDDLRLALEQLLQDLLGNEKSLENQENILKDKKVLKELSNMIFKDIKDYCCFQNNNVKHNDNSEKLFDADIEYLINKTSILMTYLIKTLGEKI